MIGKILKSLDLGADEIRVYERLLDSDTATAGDIAKKIDLPRSSIYEILKKLRDKGVVAQSMRHGVRIFQAEPPQRIKQLFERRLKNVQEDMQAFQALMPMLEQKLAQKSGLPRMQFFDGADGVKNVFLDILLYRNLKTYSFWSVKTVIELLSPDFVAMHNRERIRNGIHIQGIWPRSRTINVRKFPFMGGGPGFLRDIRIAPPEIDFAMSFWIYADKIAFLSSKGECYGFLMTSIEMVKLMTSLHHLVWRLSTPFVTDPEDVKVFLSKINA